MIRDLSRLSDTGFDLLVVGGGVHGLITAYDGAQRGLSVALVERADLGSATSFNHLKTIHGGLRYLQSADLARMRESIRERRAFARIAPRFVAPLPFIMATGRSITRSRIAMRTALAIDALIAHDRNRGLDASHHLPAGRLVSRAESGALLGGLAPAGLASGAMWFDYSMVRNDRLTLAFALAASQHGAAIANYVEAVTLLRDASGNAVGIRARDVLTGDRFDLRARAIVNAAGPWAAPFLHACGVEARWPLLKAMNLVTSRPASRAALVGQTRSGRALILLPWQGRTLVGTSESNELRTADDQRAVREEVTQFLDEVNETFPDLRLTLSDVTLVHRGVVPAIAHNGGLSLLGHSRIIDHASDGIPNALTLIGVKYTTARLVAERAIDRVTEKLGQPPVACRTAHMALPGASLTDNDPEHPVVCAVREEMAQTLADVVIRRTGIGAAAQPPAEVAMQCAAVMQQELGWSTDRTQQELDALGRFYEIDASIA